MSGVFRRSKCEFWHSSRADRNQKLVWSGWRAEASLWQLYSPLCPQYHYNHLKASWVQITLYVQTISVVTAQICNCQQPMRSFQMLNNRLTLPLVLVLITEVLEMLIHTVVSFMSWHQKLAVLEPQANVLMCKKSNYWQRAHIRTPCCAYLCILPPHFCIFIKNKLGNTAHKFQNMKSWQDKDIYKYNKLGYSSCHFISPHLSGVKSEQTENVSLTSTFDLLWPSLNCRWKWYVGDSVFPWLIH